LNPQQLNNYNPHGIADVVISLNASAC